MQKEKAFNTEKPEIVQKCIQMQAHFINNRSMEIFRPLDGLAAEVATHSPPLTEWRKFVYCESLTGRIFGEVDHFQVRVKTM